MVDAGVSRTVESTLMIRTDGFIHENDGNIKDFYKISSCIGRGKSD